jgi:hypothetical protein
MKVLVYSNFREKKLGKKWNLQPLWAMQDFTLPSVRARFKKQERKLSKGFSQTSFFLLPTFLGWCGQLLLVGTALARPAHTSSKILKHPQLLIHRSKNYEICTPVKLIARRMFANSLKNLKTNEIKWCCPNPVCPL